MGKPPFFGRLHEELLTPPWLYSLYDDDFTCDNAKHFTIANLHLSV